MATHCRGKTTQKEMAGGELWRNTTKKCLFCHWNLHNETGICLEYERSKAHINATKISTAVAGSFATTATVARTAMTDPTAMKMKNLFHNVHALARRSSRTSCGCVSKYSNLPMSSLDDSC